ncbi:GNAT family N-acetyltransferase [Ferrimicrobium sp.]|uniref:GNAT family N-acetyltransferase n=1 Tax=Ferrimicrobium sp. TaxID=2926050 RepID=UPI0026042DB2|nr:GNAT family N-acetyltransferase [Ferrimicrobium sp.]
MPKDLPIQSGDSEGNNWGLLTSHLANLLGMWPPSGRLQVLPTPRRRQPGWDGTTRALIGMISPFGTLISIDPSLQLALDTTVLAGGPRRLDTVEVIAPVHPRGQLINDEDPERRASTKSTSFYPESDGDGQSSSSQLVSHLEDALGIEHGLCFMAYFRFTFAAPNLGRPGVWVPAESGDLPEWLHPFGGRVLVAYDAGGHVAAGVGLKHHDDFVRELAVVTQPEARGRGLAKALVAQAAECVLASGMLPTYLHAPTNLASARVAEASGFVDRGWRIVGLSQAGEVQLHARLRANVQGPGH